MQRIEIEKIIFKKIKIGGLPFMAQWLTNLNGIQEGVGLIVGLTRWIQ